MSSPSLEIQEEAHALGAVILSDSSFLFPSKSSSDKFLYRHGDQSKVEPKDGGKVLVKYTPADQE